VKNISNLLIALLAASAACGMHADGLFSVCPSVLRGRIARTSHKDTAEECEKHFPWEFHKEGNKRIVVPTDRPSYRA
jgi:hypothetical protein